LGYPGYSKKEQDRDRGFQDVYYNRKVSGQPLNQQGDPTLYTSKLVDYKRWDLAEKQYRAMQSWALGILASPVLLTTVSPGALVACIRIKSTPFIVDAAIQTTLNGMQHKNIFSNYNFSGGLASLIINTPEGASFSQIAGVAFANSTISSSVTLSGNSINGSSPVFSFSPVSIMINTVFGTTAGQYSGFIGNGTGISSFGDAAASPINFGGVVLDEAIKKKE